MDRFLIERFNSDGLARLSARETHHMMDVLRHRAGETIEVRDVDGRRYRAVIRRREPEGALVEREDALEDERQTLPQVTLYQAILKGKRMDVLVEKAAELGACEIVPMTTARTVVRVDERFTQKRRRWQRKIDSALKQCDRATSVTLRDPLPFGSVCPRFGEYDLACFAALADDAVPLADLLRKAKSDVRTLALVIGPEGDFTREEMDAARRSSARLVSLGPHVLRAETAGMAALAALLYEFNATP